MTPAIDVSAPLGLGHGVDRDDVLPLYHQLKRILVADIIARGLAPGARLPGDHQLCERFAVSRTVVRQALRDLELEGVIQRIKGRGTYVAPPKTPEGLVRSLSGLYEDVTSRGSRLTSSVRRLEVIPADDIVAAVLEVPPESPVVVLERLRFVDGTPWVFVVSHVAADLAPTLVQEDFSEQSLYGVLDAYGLRRVRAHRSVEAAVADAGLARDLRIPPRAPVLLLRSVTYGEDERPVESFTAYHRGDTSRFVVDLVRTSPADRVVLSGPP